MQVPVIQVRILLKISGSTNYALSFTTNSRLAFYDANKVFISGVYPITNPIATPINAAYLRFSTTTTLLNSQQLELGDTKTAYEPYGYTIPKLILG